MSGQNSPFSVCQSSMAFLSRLPVCLFTHVAKFLDALDFECAFVVNKLFAVVGETRGLWSNEVRRLTSAVPAGLILTKIQARTTLRTWLFFCLGCGWGFDRSAIQPNYVNTGCVFDYGPLCSECWSGESHDAEPAIKKWRVA